ncbi:hypothetical protein CERSUDRAFT_114880 [Gelatoporia subvermispora B]|uniref:ABC transporter domain-containing protein n=1 Tax=Ceriporiopsis subvermispora (strain B) TaxID=914234 RepID=M2QIY1_CERS8|nr:hypothetical protein CERSUDRAFT_114880 [Gelatoporia subvermispora B]
MSTTMDPAELEQGHSLEERDHVPELPGGPSVAAAYGNAAIHNLLESDSPSGNSSERPAPPKQPSHVDVGFFDREGVNELRRNISRLSESLGQEQPRPSSGRSEGASVFSDDTLIPGDGPYDLEKALRTIMGRLESSDIKKRELGVVFNDLRVVGLGAGATYQPTLASETNPLGILDKIQAARHPPTRDILSGFEGVVKPGEMLLVLGRPGAGCSTLLRVLANQRSDYHAVYGDVRYDAFSPEDIHKHYRGDVQYCPEDDIHFPTLTVEETIRFAARTRVPHKRIQGMSREDMIALFTEVLMTVFGLRHARSTLVGDSSIRGVSGGEKKRVSICEALATRGLLFSWDNSTRGLDASTALEFVRALRIATDITRNTTIVSIYQAGESLYEHFDKVCVIYEGKMAYFGPANRARQYFIDMGYEPANRQTTADFLVAVTDPKGRILRSGFESRAPRNAIEFAEHFQHSELAERNREDMAAYRSEFVDTPKRASMYVESAQAEHARYTRTGSPYIISIPMQVRALMLRRVQIIRGAKAAQIIQVASFILQAIIVGTVFLRLNTATSTFFSRGGVLFFSLLFAAISTMAEIPALFASRPILLRQSKAAMYHPFVESLALTLVDAPFSLITTICFALILYFLVGLQQSAGQFFIFLLNVYVMTLTMKAWFRVFAAAFKNPAPAQAVAGVSVLILVLYTGYTIPMPDMIGALKWISWINPLHYGFEALMVNEFHTIEGPCSMLVPQGPGYENVSSQNQVCTTVGSVPGQTLVSGANYLRLSYNYVYSHLWRNFGIVCAFGIFLVSLYLLLTEVNTGSATETSVVLFKRGSKAAIVKEADGDDEEKQRSDASTAASAAEEEKAAREALKEAPASRNTFSWENLCYTVPVKGGQRRLLDNVSGFVAPGKLTALMGESGAGKTTLLNVLSERTSGGVITGNRFMNGNPLPPDFQAQTGYCQQMDTHLATATVREALLFSAKLRQPQSTPLAEKEAFVEKCLQMCGLEAYADAVVGSLGVEHRKRTTIAVELVAKPSMIFLDEPTSGLDSQSAWAIVCFLRNLADSGQSIVCTIHQPSAELFEVFDRLLLLRKGGQMVYFGDLGSKSTQLIKYFESHGGRRCGEAENPAEYILDVIGAGATATTVADWHDIWKKSDEASDAQQQLEAIHDEGRQRPPVKATLQGKYATSWAYQLATLIVRDLQAHWRDPVYLMAKFGLNIFSGLLIGFTFFKAKTSVQGTQDQLFAVYMSTILSVPLSNQLQVFWLEHRRVYEIRERPSRMYSWTALLSSQLLAEIPWNILGSSLYFLCWFWTVGFPEDRAGYTYLMLAVVFPLYYTTIGQAVAAMSPNAEIAALIFSFLFSFVIIFNGVLQPFRELGWWQWMNRLSPFTYVIEGLVGQALGKRSITCSSVELVPIMPPSGQSCSQFLGPFISSAGGYLTNPDATSDCLYCAYSTTDAFLSQSFNIFYSHRWRNVGLLCAYIIFNTFALFAFMYLFRLRTWSVRAMLRKKSN